MRETLLKMMFLLTSALFLQKFHLQKTLAYYIPLERKFNSEQLFCLREITKMNSLKDISSWRGHGMRENHFDVNSFWRQLYKRKHLDKKHCDGNPFLNIRAYALSARFIRVPARTPLKTKTKFSSFSNLLLLSRLSQLHN